MTHIPDDAQDALNSRLAEFFKWAMREGPWEGGDLDGGGVQERAEELGLIVKTKYDAKAHGPSNWMFEDGDDYYVFAPELAAQPPAAPVERPSVEAMKVAVEMEILSALGRVHTVKIGEMIQKIMDASRPQCSAGSGGAYQEEYTDILESENRNLKAEIERLRERCEAYKGQVQAGAAQIKALTSTEPQPTPVTQNAAVLAERLIQAAVDYEAGRCGKREMAEARAAVEAAIQPLAAPTPAFDALAAEVIERISERYNKLAASPLGMASAWERKASAGKPLLYGGKRGLLANGTIATWDEFDLIADVINNLPTLLAACSVSRPELGCK